MATALYFTNHEWEEYIPLADFTIMHRKLKMLIADSEIGEFNIKSGESIDTWLIELLRRSRRGFVFSKYQVHLRNSDKSPEIYRCAKFDPSLSLHLTEIFENIYPCGPELVELMIARIPENVKSHIQ